MEGVLLPFRGNILKYEVTDVCDLLQAMCKGELIVKKVCRDWPKEAFGSGLVDECYYDEFEKNATTAAAKVFKVKDFAEGEVKLQEILKNLAAGKYDDKVLPTKEILAVGWEERPELKAIYDNLGKDYTVFTDKFDIAKHKASAEVGISVAEFCIAESGSIVVDNKSYEARVTSMLPYTNIVFVPAKYAVKDMSVACEIIGKVFKDGYCGFVTGPSRTADIERVLSLGVHGPNYLFIIAVEDMK